MILEETLNVPLNFINVRNIEGDLVIKLGKMHEKISVMKRKSCLKNTGIWIQENYTPRQKEVQEYIERLAEYVRSQGQRVRVLYQRKNSKERGETGKELERNIVKKQF